MNNDYHYFCFKQITHMRLGAIFSNFANKVKDFGLRAGSTLAKVVPKVLKIGSFVAGGLSHLPGFIGNAAGLVYKGINAANRVIGSLPESKFKDKLQDLSSKAEATATTITPKITQVAETAKVYGDTAGKVIDAIKPRII